MVAKAQRHRPGAKVQFLDGGLLLNASHYKGVGRGFYAIAIGADGQLYNHEYGEWVPFERTCGDHELAFRGVGH